MQTKNKFTATHLYISVAVLLHAFVVLKFDTIIIDKLSSTTDINLLAVFYSVIIIVLGFGYLSFSMSKSYFWSDSVTEYIKPVMLSTAALCLFMAALIYSKTLPLIVFSAILTAYLLGYLGSWLLWSLSVFLNGTRYTGRIIGTAILMATLALSYSSISVKSELIHLLIITLFIIAFVAIIHDLWKNKFSLIPNSPNNGNNDNSIIKKGFLYVAAIALMTVLAGIGNSIFLKIYSTDKTFTMQFYHLIHGFSALLFGFLFDFRERAYYKWISATLITILAFSPFILSLTGYGTIYGITLYSFAGLFCILYLLPFINIAPHTRLPELWASYGAIARYCISGLVIIPTALLVEFVNIEMIVIINIIITVLVLRILSLSHNEADTIVFENDESIKDESIINDRNEKSLGANYGRLYAENDFAIAYDVNQLSHIKKFAKRHALTSTETKALLYIISSEESIKIISDKENISERTFQRYLSKIYVKTGVKTRAGLVSAYHKSISNEPIGSNSEISAD